jgi:hypothetical protein
MGPSITQMEQSGLSDHALRNKTSNRIATAALGMNTTRIERYWSRYGGINILKDGSRFLF